MAISQLEQADRRNVSISMPVGAKRVVLHGSAKYRRQSEFGACLVVAVDDPDGQFEIVLPEGEGKYRFMEASTGLLIVLDLPVSQPEPADADCVSAQR